MRHKGHEEHENHERWLVSYADFITLLFAFFVVMFASSQADKSKLRQVSESVAGALKDGRPGALARPTKGGVKAEKEGTLDQEGLENLKPAHKPTLRQSDLSPSMEVLAEALKEQIKKGEVNVSMEPRGLVVSLKQAAFFPSGGDTIAPESMGVIKKLAEVVGRVPNPVRLEGHTDAIPISTDRFRSNWELSAARSIAVLRAFHEKNGIPLSRMAISGYAETVAVDSNSTEEGRKRNRRVDVVVLNDVAAEKEAKPAAAEPEPEKEAHAQPAAHH